MDNRSLHIDQVPVDSSSLASIGYSFDHMILEARFRRGVIYRFFMVPAQLYADLLKAPSKGIFFNNAVRGRFPYVLIANEASGRSINYDQRD